MMVIFGVKFSGGKIVPQSDLWVDTTREVPSKQETIAKDWNMECKNNESEW
jgi:hypothetical protein